MSRIWVTNEASSFARSFATWCGTSGNHEFVNSLENAEYDYFRQDNKFRKKEIDIFDPTLSTLISRSGAEVIIHQLPITPDNSIKYIDHALRNNIEGTYYIIEAAKEVGIPVIFISTRNYSFIKKSSPSNVYDITALAAENMFDISSIKHTSVIPPLLYGPEYDEGIAGLIKTAIDGKEQVVINFDPEKKHAFMHVDDFFKAISLIIDDLNSDSSMIEKPVINIKPKDRFCFEDILKKLEGYNFFLSYEFHPEFDTIEEVNTNIENISDVYEWRESFDIDSGLSDVIDKLKNDDN